MPFTTQELYQNGSEALYCGLNALSNNLIMVDRKFLKNPNGLILGTPGSGKSFAAKREIANVYLVTNDDIIICDPEAEYGPLVERLHGQVIKISPTSPHFINPMDLNLNYSDDENPLSLKSDFILSLCELIVGGKDGLQPVEKTIIDRCVRLIYRNYLNDPRPENMPVLEDLYHELRRQEEKEAQYVATALEIYVTGSLNVFNHRTNVDIQNRIVAFDIKELGKQLKKIGMLVVQDQVWNRVTINREAHKATRYYIDEFHLLLKEEQTAAYSVEIWKRFRKWGGIPTGITQNVKVRPDRALCKAVYACDRHTADAEFLLAQREYAQLTGRAQDGGVILYQIRQSFKPGEITPEEANRVGYELASRFLKGKHAFFVCTHTDKKHIHNHIYAVEEKLILANPAKKCKIPKNTCKEMNILPEALIGPYLSAAKEHGILAPMYLELTTGLRRGELLALRWEDLDVQNRTLSINKSVVRQDGKLVISTPKTSNSIRTVLLPEETVKLLVEEHDRHPANPYLFPSPRTGETWDPDGFRRLHDRIIKEIGAEHVRFHDMRHTFATLSLKSGVDVRTLSETLGHFSAGFTLSTYVHSTPGMKQSAADAIGNTIRNAI